MSRKIKDIRLLQCKESASLFRALGRHRALRELNKAHVNVRAERDTDGKFSVMDVISWGESPQGSKFWVAVYHNRSREVLKERLA